MSTSHLVASLTAQLAYAGLPEPVREYRFWPGRRFAFDLCWPDLMLAVECEGGAFSGGRHSRGAGMTTDSTKYNEATIRGYRVLRFTPPMIRTPKGATESEAVATIRRAFGAVEPIAQAATTEGE